MILVSACLAGMNCRFDGSNKENEKVVQLVKTGKADKIKQQFSGIMLEKDKIITRGRKDMIDTMASAVESAKVNIQDIPVYPYIKKEYKDIKEMFNLKKDEELEEL